MKNEQTLPYASCDNCIYKYRYTIFGCHLRSSIIMQEDKSPCLVWDDGSDS